MTATIRGLHSRKFRAFMLEARTSGTAKGEQLSHATELLSITDENIRRFHCSLFLNCGRKGGTEDTLELDHQRCCIGGILASLPQSHRSDGRARVPIAKYDRRV